jgi:hypothetical protein
MNFENIIEIKNLNNTQVSILKKAKLLELDNETYKL